MADPSVDPKAKPPLVLLVDDVLENIQVAGHSLRDCGVEIAVAWDGAEALAFVQEDVPDLILLDVMLPDIDGFEVCRRLKRMPELAPVPVIFLTARTDTEDVVRGFEVGAVDYVPKPFRPAELKARVKTHLQLHQLRRLLSVCCYCSQVRNGDGSWERLDAYIHRKTGARFSHGICPSCADKLSDEMELCEGDGPVSVTNRR